MADTVHSHLERRVPELEDLFKKGLFSKDEVKEIVAKRTKFEYKIKRRGCLKDDFLAYIKYETELEATRKLRYHQLNIKGKHTVSDHSIVQYILGIYRRALVKFKGDLDLWFSYVQFAKDAEAEKVVSRIYASALQLHPHCTELWSDAASWEFVHHSNPNSARTLFQRGLRINKESKSLWLSYFKMECEVVQILRSNAHETEEETADSLVSVYRGAIPISVFRHAAKEVGLTASDAFEFYTIAGSFDALDAVCAFIETLVAESMADQASFCIRKAHLLVERYSASEDAKMLEQCMLLLNSLLARPVTLEVLDSVVALFEKLVAGAKGQQELLAVIFHKADRLLTSLSASETFSADVFSKWMQLAQASGEPAALARIQMSASEQHPLDSRFIGDDDKGQALYNFCTKCVELGGEEAADSINRLFKESPVGSDQLLELAVKAATKHIAAEGALVHLLSHSGLDSLEKACRSAKVSSSFLSCIAAAFLKLELFSSQHVSFIAKMATFQSHCFADTKCSLLALKYAFLVADYSMVSRLYSLTVESVPHPDAFIADFEKMKDSLCC